MHVVKTFGKNENGTAAIEAAIVLPVAIFLMMGTLEASFTFYTYTEMQHHTREFVRRVAVGMLTPAEAEQELKSSLPAWAKGYASAKVSESHPNDVKVNIVTATTSIPIRNSSPLAFFFDRIDGQITAANSMKQEVAP